MSTSRQLRRRIARTSTATPIGPPGTLAYSPDKIIMAIHHGEATLNWQASEAEVKESFNKLNSAPMARELGPQAYKEELRNIIIIGLERNEHLQRKQANLFASVAMWYMWLKRDTILAQSGHTNFDRIGRLAMGIIKGENNWYQFTWEIKFKEELELPDLARVNVWTPFRADEKFEAKR